MANRLDEMTGPVSETGKNINVINKQLKIEVGKGSKIFQIVLWLFILPGFIFWIKKIKAKNYLDRLEQKIQAAASQYDNYLDQRVQILENIAGLLKQSINIDKDIFTSLAALRSGTKLNDQKRNELATEVDLVNTKLNVAFENYPELKSQDTVLAAMKQNDYTQREISASRSNYNDFVSRWNQDIQVWPTYKIVAAKNGFTTRIPFTASQETKTKAQSTFF
ncbi:LemA protein [Entomoplasma freundtii]|uniref:LemA family protein n=1 Tax=Entomoplasma freundtii TaxID=74700 RepID=A0A2K8NUI1_9MOLU|nr:LemA family protein [Entomoplasma freundtii]ATZ16283.1 LemA family protein [Entomoplasma freundtii]TDY56815.1 LemA protein [Entomoplasma freundtii]